MTAHPAWLDAALAYVPQWLSYQMRSTEQPGCAIAIRYRGDLVLEQAFGHADLAAGEALTPRHRFRVASHSKTFTTVGIMKLREQGRLKLDDMAGQYVEGLHPDIAAATIAQLLSHTAGIFRDGEDCAYWAQRAEFADLPRVRADLTLPPAIDAGLRLKYSNHGYALAGLVIEAITGEPYHVWMQREVVLPAGLSETTPDVPVAEGARLAQGHSTKLVLGRRVVFPSGQSTHALVAATGFVSTAADLTRFFAQLAPKAIKSILSPASRREMTRPQWADPYSTMARSYGLGTITGTSPGSSSGEGWKNFGHSGGFPGTLTRTSVVAEPGIAVSILTNAADGMCHAWMDGVLAILQTFERQGPPDARTAGWTGRWWSGWGATDLVPMGAKVLLALPGQINPFEKVPELAVTGADTARIDVSGAFGSYGEPVALRRDAAGQVVAVKIAGSVSLAEADLAQEMTARFG